MKHKKSFPSPKESLSQDVSLTVPLLIVLSFGLCNELFAQLDIGNLGLNHPEKPSLCRAPAVAIKDRLGGGRLL